MSACRCGIRLHFKGGELRYIERWLFFAEARHTAMRYDGRPEF